MEHGIGLTLTKEPVYFVRKLKWGTVQIKLTVSLHCSKCVCVEYECLSFPAVLLYVWRLWACSMINCKFINKSFISCFDHFFFPLATYLTITSVQFQNLCLAGPEEWNRCEFNISFIFIWDALFMEVLKRISINH